MLQSPVLLRRSVIDNVAFSLRHAGLPASIARARSQAALVEAGLAHLAELPARVLSGGEKQRLSLVRALILDPPVLLLDEPTAGLDPASATAIERRIALLRTAGKSVLLVSHDLRLARRLADTVWLMHEGQIAEAGPAARFFTQPATREGKEFLDA
jgi:tungstate transport system ATP-binding protein